jgi:uncharacterized protein YkwD
MRRLLPVLVFCLGCGPAVAPVSPAPGPGNPFGPPDLVRASARLLAGVNAQRAAKGLPPLVEHPLLRAIAAAHSADMARRDRLDHTGGDGSSPWERLDRVGYRYRTASENVAWGQASPEQVVGDWMTSSGHRANVLGPYVHFGGGVGLAPGKRPYWTAEFGSPP